MTVLQAAGDADTPAAAPEPTTVSRETARARAFGERAPLADRFAEVLATDGVARGLLGPREVDRIWERHLFNCAAIAPLIPTGARVIDVGSGAGLPGIVLAIARPDLSVVLVEPLLRRVDFLMEVCSSLNLSAVSVRRARAEDAADLQAPAVVARAVAPLDRLLGWCLPLVQPGGRLLAMKGRSAAEELAASTAALRAARATGTVVQVGAELGSPTYVVSLRRR